MADLSIALSGETLRLRDLPGLPVTPVSIGETLHLQDVPILTPFTSNVASLRLADEVVACIDKRPIIVIDGEAVTTRVRMASLHIEQQRGQPHRCSFRMGGSGSAPTEGQAVQIGVSGLGLFDLQFAGRVTMVTQTYEGKPANVCWDVSAFDHSWQLNSRRPIKAYALQSASLIFADLIGTFAPGFTATHVEDDLPDVAINFDGQDEFFTCLENLAKAASTSSDPCYWYLDYTRDLHAYTTESLDPPDDLDGTVPVDRNGQQLLPALAIDSDIFNARNRVYGKGHGESVPADVNAGDMIVPVADAVMFNPLGGRAIVAQTPDGAATDRITYDGVQLGGAGSIVGQGASPSTAPVVTAQGGAGLGSGVYKYAYTDVTAAGESLPSPLGSVTTGAATDPVLNSASFQVNLLSSSSEAGLVVGDVIDFGIQTSYDLANTVGVSHLVVCASGFTVPAANGGGPALVIPTWNITVGDLAIDRYAHVMWRRGSGDPWKYFADLAGAVVLSSNPASSQGQYISRNVLVSSTPNADVKQVAGSGVAVGASGTTSRKVYRTAANGSQLKLLTTFANNTTTTFTDTAADGSLGANAPTSDNSGLTLVSGQVLAGSTSLPLASAGPFASTGGWAILSGSQTIRYTGLSGNSLTGIPTSGPGAIVTTVLYGSQALPAPALTGVENPSTSGLLNAIAKGARAHIWVQRDNLSAQAALAALDHTGEDDGVREHVIVDERRGEDSLSAACDADLALWSAAIRTLHYATRDRKTRAGKTVNAVNLGPLSITGSFLIQEVTIDNFEATAHLGTFPLYSVVASPVLVTFDKLLQSFQTKAA